MSRLLMIAELQKKVGIFRAHVEAVLPECFLLKRALQLFSISLARQIKKKKTDAEEAEMSRLLVLKCSW